MSNSDHIIDGMPAWKWVEEFNAHTERWGNLASGTIPRRDVRKAIMYLEGKIKESKDECTEIVDNRENRVQELHEELTLSNRRLAASRAREERLKKRLKEMEVGDNE